jgi:glutathione S-transferase
MPNLLPTLFIALASTALILTLVWLWQSLRHAFVHTLGAPPVESIVSPERAALLAEKGNLLVALKDLEAERESGKLSQEDFRELNAQYRQRARAVLQELDGMLAQHRADAKRLLAGAELQVAAPSAAAAAPGCKRCGVANDPDAVFCKKCGARLEAGV